MSAMSYSRTWWQSSEAQPLTAGTAGLGVSIAAREARTASPDMLRTKAGAGRTVCTPLPVGMRLADEPEAPSPFGSGRAAASISSPFRSGGRGNAAVLTVAGTPTSQPQPGTVTRLSSERVTAARERLSNERVLTVSSRDRQPPLAGTESYLANGVRSALREVSAPFKADAAASRDASPLRAERTSTPIRGRSAYSTALAPPLTVVATPLAAAPPTAGPAIAAVLPSAPSSWAAGASPPSPAQAVRPRSLVPPVMAGTPSAPPIQAIEGQWVPTGASYTADPSPPGGAAVTPPGRIKLSMWQAPPGAAERPSPGGGVSAPPPAPPLAAVATPGGASTPAAAPLPLLSATGSAGGRRSPLRKSQATLLTVTCPEGHPMVSLGTSRDDGWDCDARGEAGGCCGGITGFNQTAGMNRYRCDLCVYDLCEKCYLARSIAASQAAAAGAAAAAAEATAAAAAAVGDSAIGPMVNMPPEARVATTADAPRSGTPRKARALCAKPGGPNGFAFGAAAVAPLPQQGGTAPSSAGPPALSAPPQDAGLGGWSTEWTIRLGAELDLAIFVEPVLVLDQEQYSSVNQAVDALNRGVIQCVGEVCVAYSASSRGWYLLFRNRRKEAAMTVLGISEAFTSWAENLPMQPSQPNGASQQLAPGLVVRIRDCTCQVTAPLGMGSFGAVWAADRCDGLGEVAIKEIHCQSATDLSNATYEAKLLQVLGQDRASTASSSRPPRRSALDALSGQETTAADVDSRGNSTADKPLDRIPALVAMQTDPVGPSLWRVRLAMTKVPGVPLDRFFEWWRREPRPVGGEAAPSQLQLFLEACRFAQELIAQMVPIFETISARAYHRDVNSHNILVDGGDAPGRPPRFGLVDFGLAADLGQWRGNMSATSWHLVDIGGDCRYWPMAAWLQFECGWQELVKYPALSSEYQNQLDLHSLGITALQVLAAMAPVPPQPQPAAVARTPTNGEVPEATGGSSSSDGLPEEVVALYHSWEQYWQDATRYWSRLLECFRNHGDQNSLKGMCIQEGVHNIIGQDLASLRTALRDVRNACGRPGGLQQQGTARPGGESLASVRPLFEALLALVSAGGVVGEAADGTTMPSWQDVRAVLAPHDPPRSVSAGMSHHLPHRPQGAVVLNAHLAVPA